MLFLDVSYGASMSYYIFCYHVLAFSGAFQGLAVQGLQRPVSGGTNGALVRSLSATALPPMAQRLWLTSVHRSNPCHCPWRNPQHLFQSRYSFRQSKKKGTATTWGTAGRYTSGTLHYRDPVSESRCVVRVLLLPCIFTSQLRNWGISVCMRTA